MTFAPFQNESDGMTIGGLTLENRADHVSIFGTLAITRDRAGLEAAKALREKLDAVVKALEDEPALPSRIAATTTPISVKNPFA